MAMGIEKISAYPGSMQIPMLDLVNSRGKNTEEIVNEMMIDERSVNPPWEDAVTMAVNAANDLLTADDKASIGLLLVASESGLDQEKSLSTWVQRFLDLPDDCRNCEIKIACYGGTAGLYLARAALSLLPSNKKVLVITTDVSRMHFGKPYEFVMGCGAVAFLVSNNPEFLEINSSPTGVYTYEVSDLIRPTSHVEAGHSETSLLSYLEGILITFERYMEQLVEPVINTIDNFRTYMPYQIYHAPFSGITMRAHKSVHKYFGKLDKDRFNIDYQCSVLPSLQYNRRMGGTYAASVFISMLGLADSQKENIVNKRVGIYSYGSGSCAEFYSGNFGQKAYEISTKANLAGKLKDRKILSIDEYESAEQIRNSYTDLGDFSVTHKGFEAWYEEFYQDRGLLEYCGSNKYVREYKWS